MAREEAQPSSGSTAGGDQTLESVEAIVDQYDAEWQRGGRPDLALFLPAAGLPHRQQALIRLIAIDLRQRARRGETARLEQYVQRFAELGPASALPWELIVAEYSARNAAGEQLSIGEYARRFPAQVDRLRSEWISNVGPASAAAPSMPLDLQPGARIGDFQIVRLLGKGGFARVYLARQLSLDRHVALKVSRSIGDEGKTLAQLDHPHIVPVYSEQVAEGRKLLAMRYVPGATLAEWLVGRGAIARRHWRGRDLLAWIASQLEPPARCVSPPARARFAARRFVPAMCQLVLGLARALQHAHQQGVLHCDIKPANILLDVDGRALLMDFNVAARGTGQAAAGRQLRGGTLPYMAPEHLAALVPHGDRPPPNPDQRSDIYSLGIVFYEVLAGRHPWSLPETTVASMAVVREMLAARLQGAPQLPPGVATAGLRSIVAKCLAPQAERRYQSADELADDLERWLDHRPLVSAPDPSRAERLAKWVHRRPRRSTAVAALAVVGIFALLLVAWSDLDRLGRAEHLLAEATQALATGAGGAAADRVEAARGMLAGHSPTRLSLGAARRRAANERIAALAQQAAVAEMQHFQTLNDRRRGARLPPTAPSDLSADPLRVYRVLERRDWEQLPAFRDLDVRNRVQISEDITELLVARAIAHADHRPAPGTADSSAQWAASNIDLLGRVPALHHRLPLLVALRRSLISSTRRRRRRCSRGWPTAS